MCVIVVPGVTSWKYYKVIIITIVPRSSSHRPNCLYQVRVFSVTENFQSLTNQLSREIGREIMNDSKYDGQYERQLPNVPRLHFIQTN